MTDKKYDLLLDIFNTDGVIDCVEFDLMAGDVLREAGYEEDDLDSMSVDDIIGEIGDMFGMKLEQDSDNVYLVDYVDN